MSWAQFKSKLAISLGNGHLGWNGVICWHALSQQENSNKDHQKNVFHRTLFAVVIIIISYISRVLLHFRKRFLVHLSHLLWSSCKSMNWVFLLHFRARKLRLRKIKVTLRKNILWQDLSPSVPASKLVFTSRYFRREFALSWDSLEWSEKVIMLLITVNLDEILKYIQHCAKHFTGVSSLNPWTHLWGRHH